MKFIHKFIFIILLLLAPNFVYAKSVNMDGTVNINLYELSQIKPAD